MREGLGCLRGDEVPFAFDAVSLKDIESPADDMKQGYAAKCSFQYNDDLSRYGDSHYEDC